MTENYHCQSKISEGAYGIVWKAVHKIDGRTVAIKQMKDVPETEEDLEFAMRELEVLQRCVGHPNLVQMLEAHQSARGRLYLVFEYIPFTLKQLLHCNQEGIPLYYAKKMMWQLLSATHFLHKNQIMHRDMKPANVLVTAEGDIKLCDLGLARSVKSSADCQELTTYVVTRWYRPVEVLLGDTYGWPIDIWSLGCMFVEMVTGKPLFPGKSAHEQLWLILKAISGLTEGQLELLRNDPQFACFTPPRATQMEPLEKMLSQFSPEMMAVVKACLQVDPDKRLPAASIMKLPFFQDMTPESSSPREVISNQSSCDSSPLCAPTLRPAAEDDGIVAVIEDAGHTSHQAVTPLPCDQDLQQAVVAPVSHHADPVSDRDHAALKDVLPAGSVYARYASASGQEASLPLTGSLRAAVSSEAKIKDFEAPYATATHGLPQCKDVPGASACASTGPAWSQQPDKLSRHAPAPIPRRAHVLTHGLGERNGIARDPADVDFLPPGNNHPTGVPTSLHSMQSETRAQAAPTSDQTCDKTRTAGSELQAADSSSGAVAPKPPRLRRNLVEGKPRKEVNSLATRRPTRRQTWSCNSDDSSSDFIPEGAQAPAKAQQLRAWSAAPAGPSLEPMPPGTAVTGTGRRARQTWSSGGQERIEEVSEIEAETGTIALDPRPPPTGSAARRPHRISWAGAKSSKNMLSEEPSLTSRLKFLKQVSDGAGDAASKQPTQGGRRVHAISDSGSNMDASLPTYPGPLKPTSSKNVLQPLPPGATKACIPNNTAKAAAESPYPMHLRKMMTYASSAWSRGLDAIRGGSSKGRSASAARFSNTGSESLLGPTNKAEVGAGILYDDMYPRTHQLADERSSRVQGKGETREESACARKEGIQEIRAARTGSSSASPGMDGPVNRKGPFLPQLSSK